MERESALGPGASRSAHSAAAFGGAGGASTSAAASDSGPSSSPGSNPGSSSSLPVLGGPGSQPRRPRVLCLHSFRTSAAIFRQQLRKAQLLDALAEEAELVFVDAPHAASGPIPRDVSPHFAGPHFEWFTASAVGDTVEFSEAVLEASERFLAQQLVERGPFDGLIGFSQGAVMATALIAMQRAGHPPAGDAAAPPLPRSLRFALLFAGMRSRHPRHVAAFDALGGKIPCPSLHVYGDRDQLKNPHCVELADTYGAATVVLHQRGHVLPVLPPPQLAALRALMRTALAAPPPPPPPPSLTPPSLPSQEAQQETQQPQQQQQQQPQQQQQEVPESRGLHPAAQRQGQGIEGSGVTVMPTRRARL